MYHQRLQSDRLLRLAAGFPVVVVTGARQVGKTTLLRHVFPGHDYVVFDASLDLEDARREPDLFLLNHPPPLILDEVQFAPEVVAAVKRRVDRAPERPGQYLLTGSQQWQVIRTLAESLAGRAAFVDLAGFSLQERARVTDGWLPHWLTDRAAGLAYARTAGRFDGALADWLWRGSLPRAAGLAPALIPDFWTGYHRTYVERDARLLAEVADWHAFGRFVQLLSALTAQEVNYSQLGRAIGLTPQTAQRWLRVLEGTFQWFALPAFSGNPTKRVSARPKGCLADTGLACWHAQLSSPRALTGHPLFGPLFETAMIGELRKQSALLPLSPACHHWRTAGGAEVDLVLEYDGVLYPFEFKLTANPTRRMTSGLTAFRQAHPHLRVGAGALVCAVEQPRWLGADVLALPWNLL